MVSSENMQRGESSGLTGRVGAVRVSRLLISVIQHVESAADLRLELQEEDRLTGSP